MLSVDFKYNMASIAIISDITITNVLHESSQHKSPSPKPVRQNTQTFNEPYLHRVPLKIPYHLPRFLIG